MKRVRRNPVMAAEAASVAVVEVVEVESAIAGKDHESRFRGLSP